MKSAALSAGIAVTRTGIFSLPPNCVSLAFQRTAVRSNSPGGDESKTLHPLSMSGGSDFGIAATESVMGGLSSRGVFMAVTGRRRPEKHSRATQGDPSS